VIRDPTRWCRPRFPDVTSGRAAQDLPLVVRLGNTATCGCGEHIDRGERVGALVAVDRIFCLSCMADIQAGRLDLSVFAATLAAAEYNARVRANAEKLLNRLHAARLMDTLATNITEVVDEIVDDLGDRGLPHRVEPHA
jgi:hypothetical protein